MIHFQLHPGGFRKTGRFPAVSGRLYRTGVQHSLAGVLPRTVIDLHRWVVDSSAGEVTGGPSAKGPSSTNAEGANREGIQRHHRPSCDPHVFAREGGRTPFADGTTPAKEYVERTLPVSTSIIFCEAEQANSLGLADSFRVSHATRMPRMPFPSPISPIAATDLYQPIGSRVRLY